MSFKINRLIINNFKTFKDIDIEINGSILTILDGPNGFGKTSFYDAIELLFTGSIKRYNELETKTVDKRENKQGCPFVYKKAQDDEFLSIKIELDNNGKTIFIERYESVLTLNSYKSISSTSLKLREVKYLNSNVTNIEIDDEKVFFENILGSNYLKNFHLFHYIEQEENTALLKDKGKSKQEKIAHLFDISEINEKLENLKSAKKLLLKLNQKDKSAEIDQLKNEISQLKNNLTPTNEEVLFKKLILCSEQPWDNENISFDTNTYSSWLGSDGILEQLECFILNISEYEKVLFNKQIKKELYPKDTALNALIKYGNHIENIDNYKKDILTYNEISLYLSETLADIVKSIKEKKLDIPSSIINILPDNFSLIDYNKDKNHLHNLIKKADKFTRNMLQLKSLRDSYIEAFNNHHQGSPNINECPTCGFKWKDKEELLLNINIQTELFNQLIIDTNENIINSLNLFNNLYISTIKTYCNNFININVDIIKVKEEVINLDVGQLAYLSKYKNDFEKHNINILSLINKNLENEKEEANKIDILSEISKKYLPVDNEKIHDYFNDIFESIFAGDIQNTKKINKIEIAHKKDFIKQQYSQSLVALIRNKETELNNKSVIYSKANKLSTDLTILINTYNTSMKNHLKSISKDIEILFHVYSGRLLQNYQQGLGIFIENKGNSISFKESPNHEHDVIFSMSSGQLSALIISFTLALNKRYAKNNLLLIDDPVQTLDEINISGFVDLLRNEFNDRQIFISTHEDNMSSFMRYKFNKMNLHTNRVSFKQKALKNNN